MQYIQQGTESFHKVNLALFIGGFITFTTLYCVQPLMPVFSKEFNVSPAVSSLSLSFSTIGLSISMFIMAPISNKWGRKPIMTMALIISAILLMISAFLPHFSTFLFLRLLEGIVLAGLPAIAMTYLGEEINPHHLGIAMGLYISGNSLGGMTGRILTGVLTDLTSWRVVMFIFGLMGIVGGFLFWKWLPKSSNFHSHSQSPKQMLISFVEALRDPGLLCLYGISFLLMGSFVCLYNYIGYLLLGPPYNFSQTVVGFIFVVYLVGTFASTWMGKMADQLGRRKMLWIGVTIMFVGVIGTLFTNIVLKILFIAVFTFGFFSSHSVASSWVGRRGLDHKAEASALYLLFFYLGSSVAGTVGGVFWFHYHWAGVVALLSGFLMLAVVLSFALTRVPLIKESKQTV